MLGMNRHDWLPDPTQDDRHAGLCARCLKVRRIENDRGSVFYRCDYSRVDPSYPKYPLLPVLRCAAFVKAVSRADAQDPL
jgi:hypothetical protein